MNIISDRFVRAVSRFIQLHHIMDLEHVFHAPNILIDLHYICINISI